MELTFFGGAGDNELGELGGVQVLFHDPERQTKFLFECGQRPDHTSEFYGFPYRPKGFDALALSEFLQLYPPLEGLYRSDYETFRRRENGELPLAGILVSHAHYDHIGGLTLVRHDLPVFMHPTAKQILWVWQYTSGRTVNQFVDLFYNFSKLPKTTGGERFASGLEAQVRREIKLFEEGKPFKVGNISAIPYPIDHSLPGSCGFIVETSAGKMGISGDIRKRGRRPEDTERFVEALLEQKVDYLMWEGSLLHFDHEGTEDDVSEAVSRLLKGKAFAAIAFPPRDFDRLTSLYRAAKANRRMLIVNPAQVLALKMFDGQYGFPRMDWKYIGVYLPRKRKGLLDREGYPDEMVAGDYFYWERRFLEMARWEGHASKVQRVSVEDIRENQNQFLVFMPFSYMPEMLEEIRPAENSIYIRSHPAPWTPEMAIQEERQINLLKAFGMYDGIQRDYLTPTIERKMHQVHVTGHLNRRETRELLRKFNCPIIVYHCQNPFYFVEDVASHTKVIIPQRGEKFTIG